MKTRELSEDRRLHLTETVPPPPTAIAPTTTALAAAPKVSIERRFGLLLRRRKRWVVGTMIVGIVAAAVYCRWTTPTFTASAQVMLQCTSATAPEDRRTLLATQQQLVLSTPVLAMALTSPGVRDIDALRGQPDALKVLKRSLQVDAGHNDDLVGISYDSADPRQAMRLVEAVVNSYIRFETGLRASLPGTENSNAAIAAERSKAQEAWKQKWDTLQQFADTHGLAEGDEQVDSGRAALHALALKVADAHVQTVAARAEYDEILRDVKDDQSISARLQALPDDDSYSGGNDHAVADQIVALRSQLGSYSGHYMANYPAVQTLQHKIDDLKLTRDAMIRHRWLAAVRCEGELQAS
ncbi:MAG: hypothetical protein JO353_02450, partial [Phycisphaerae bacterium]|nr:hypothetical protein [Phycisphaerae bacterium]